MRQTLLNFELATPCLPSCVAIATFTFGKIAPTPTPTFSRLSSPWVTGFAILFSKTFCLAEVSLFCFDRSVVTLPRRASVLVEVSLFCFDLFSEEHQLHHPPLPPIFYSQFFPLSSRVTANIVFYFFIFFCNDCPMLH